MPPSEPPLTPPERRVDWRAWLVVVWALWFGTLYVKMVVERRGAKLREIVTKSERH